MVPLVLALAVSAAPPPAVDAWARQVCPPSKKEARSNAEFKVQQAERVACLERAMNQAVDKVLRPLQKKEPGTFRQWVALQSDYHQWASEACAAVEEALWINTRTGEHSMGTAYGSTERECLQGQYAWRGFFAETWSRGDWKTLASVLERYAQGLPRRRDALAQYRQRAAEAAGRAPAKVERMDSPSRKLTQDEWARYSSRLNRVANAPPRLAERQCALLPKAKPSCPELLLPAFMEHLDFHEALGVSEER
ncbi:hypothetical protein [Stigmatella aurantiaca]|uniref:Uncharacterized protein n=1 Tax=Stigmatella aurantiaca (strain DW4/3-1) TaxID=378806 RepID=Q098J5_STIAD|nr:hypothetical protein [Stigmatella aurantiaca]ADO68121.1 uncharacterized protein STAUR_0312 [Stigmatella aurantiaca DW4/3-1]EAU68156.1 hypothetical protein STIAU_2689 [Stigmatella aurantiaca DW4/3-1]